MDTGSAFVSLSDFPSSPSTRMSLTPRSKLACSLEGVTLSDLCSNGLQIGSNAFPARASSQCSEYIESRRKNLLHTVTKRYRQLLADDRTLSSLMSGPSSRAPKVAVNMSERGDSEVSSGYSHAEDTIGAIQLERERVHRLIDGKKEWLAGMLKQEKMRMERLKKAQEASKREEADRQVYKKKVIARKEKNEEKRRASVAAGAIAEATAAARERELLKEEFLKAQKDRELKMQAILEKRQKLADREKAAQDAALAREKELELKKDREAAEREKKLQLVAMADHKRLSLITKKKKMTASLIGEKSREASERFLSSLTRNVVQDSERRKKILLTMREKEERAEQDLARRRQTAEALKAQSQSAEDKRLTVRLTAAQHEHQKKTDLIKKELDTRVKLVKFASQKQVESESVIATHQLKELDKYLAVQRQKRKEEFQRSLIARSVEAKDAKAELILTERKKLIDLNRKVSAEVLATRERARSLILNSK